MKTDQTQRNRSLPITVVLSLFISTLLTTSTHQAHAARSLSARRVRNPNASRQSADRYDRSITTFHPEGRLLQLEYSLIAAEERGWGLTVFVEWEGIVIFAFPSSHDDRDYLNDASTDMTIHVEETNDTIGKAIIHDNSETCNESTIITTSTQQNNNPSHNTKIHRLSPTHLLLTSGLAGDARTLASAFRRQLSKWTHLDYGEVISARELAREVGRVRHGIGLRAGARVLGVVGMVIGLDDIDDNNYDDIVENEECFNDLNVKDNVSLGVEVRMYRSLPGGTMDRCNIFCTGGGADAAGNLARKEAMEALQNVVSSSKKKDDSVGNIKVDELDVKCESVSSKEDELQKIIEEVGRVALKYHPNCQSNMEDITEKTVKDANVKRKGAVDIWVVRAVPAAAIEEDNDSKRSMSRNYAFVNEHRRLGKASMDIQYASRIALDQLTDASKCFNHANNQN